MTKQLDRVRPQRPRRPLSVELLEVRELLSHGVNSVSGEAFGVFADANVAGVHVTLPKTPDVILPPSQVPNS